MNKQAPTAEHVALRRRIARLARVMDSSIRVPVVGKRIGWDAVIGLIPGIGDLAGAAISGYIVVAAMRLGVPRRGIARMVANVGMETLVGAVPVFGDFFDMAFRANERNVAVIDRHLGKHDAVAETEGAPRDRQVSGLVLFVLGLGSVIAAGAFASRLLASTL